MPLIHARCITEQRGGGALLSLARNEVFCIEYIEKHWVFGQKADGSEGWCPEDALLPPEPGCVHSDLGTHAWTDGSTDITQGIAAGCSVGDTSFSTAIPGHFIGSATAELLAVYLCLRYFESRTRPRILVIHTDSQRVFEYLGRHEKAPPRRLASLVELCKAHFYCGARIEWTPRERNVAHRVSLRALRDARKFAWVVTQLPDVPLMRALEQAKEA